MTIIFLCGSLEPGSDGVGDYIRKLSAALLKMGHMVAAIALNDRQIRLLEEGHQAEDNLQIPVLRIPSLLPHAEKFRLASGFIEKWKPDWLSLQFVPYAFHEKGIPFGWARKLKQLGGKRS